MTRKELIDHLQHLEKYTHYSEDAPALREAIEMLKCSEIPNSSDERTDKRTGTHACDCISRQQAIDALAKMMPSLMSADGSHPADEEIFKAQEIFADCIESIEILPSAQPEQQWIPCSDCERRCKKWELSKILQE